MTEDLSNIPTEELERLRLQAAKMLWRLEKELNRRKFGSYRQKKPKINLTENDLSDRKLIRRNKK